MEKILILMIILFATSVNALYYDLDLEYDAGEIFLKNISIEVGDASYLSGGYIAQVADSQGQDLNVTFFHIPLDLAYDGFDEEGFADRGGVISLEQLDFNLQLPYFEEAYSINIFDGQLNRKLTIPLQEYVQEVPAALGIESEIEPDYEPSGNIFIYVIIVLLLIGIVIYLIKKK